MRLREVGGEEQEGCEGRVEELSLSREVRESIPESGPDPLRSEEQEERKVARGVRSGSEIGERRMMGRGELSVASGWRPCRRESNRDECPPTQSEAGPSAGSAQ